MVVSKHFVFDCHSFECPISSQCAGKAHCGLSRPAEHILGFLASEKGSCDASWRRRQKCVVCCHEVRFLFSLHACISSTVITLTLPDELGELLALGLYMKHYAEGIPVCIPFGQCALPCSSLTEIFYLLPPDAPQHHLRISPHKGRCTWKRQN